MKTGKLDLSSKSATISNKILSVFIVMTLLISLELFVLSFAMNTLSAVRALVEGEALWSKAQKDAVHSLQGFLSTGDETYYALFNNHLKIPLADRKVRQELKKANPDHAHMYRNFLLGGIHPEDIDGIIKLLHRFGTNFHIQKAMEYWREGDLVIDDMIALAKQIEVVIKAEREMTDNEYNNFFSQLEKLNRQATIAETKFSASLSNGSRWLEGTLFVGLLILVITVEFSGLCFIYVFNRRISRGLTELLGAAKKIGLGKFDDRITVRSQDEIGILGSAINEMSSQLKSNISRRREAENLSHVKTVFLANMSHEIRTPLGLIIGFASFLENEGVDAQSKKKYANIIKTSAENLTDIINDILDISKVESGHLTIHTEDTEIKDVLMSLQKFVQLRADEKGLELELIFNDNFPQRAHTDAVRVRQILLNVLSNAIKFTDKGKIVLEAALCDNKLTFEIRDSGVGIPPTDRDLIFEPFRQVDQSCNRRNGGTGLGLPLSKHLAELLGGDLVLKESHLGQGSVFCATIDYIPAREATLPSLKSVPKIPVIEETEICGKSVLVADDSPENRLLIGTILRKWGCRVDLVENGEQCVKLASERSYDIILMDLQMPVLDGWEATQMLRKSGLRIPIVALTAHAMREVADSCQASGFSGFVSKPVRIDKLLDTMQRLLQKNWPRAHG